MAITVHAYPWLAMWGWGLVERERAALINLLTSSAVTAVHTRMHCRGHDRGNASVLWQVTFKYNAALTRMHWRWLCRSHARGKVAVMTAAKNARGNASKNEHVDSWMHCRGRFSIFRTATLFVSNKVSDTPRPLWVFPFHNGWQEGGGRYQIRPR